MINNQSIICNYIYWDEGLSRIQCLKDREVGSRFCESHQPTMTQQERAASMRFCRECGARHDNAPEGFVCSSCRGCQYVYGISGSSETLRCHGSVSPGKSMCDMHRNYEDRTIQCTHTIQPGSNSFRCQNRASGTSSFCTSHQCFGLTGDHPEHDLPLVTCSKPIVTRNKRSIEIES